MKLKEEEIPNIANSWILLSTPFILKNQVLFLSGIKLPPAANTNPWASQSYLASSPVNRTPHHPHPEFEKPFLQRDQNRGLITQRNEDGTETGTRTGAGANLEQDLERIEHNSWKLSQPEGINSSKVSEDFDKGIRMDLELEQELDSEEAIDG